MRGRATDAPPAFDADWYLRAYPEVARSGMAPELHYLRFGRAEGRLPRAMAAPEHDHGLWHGLRGPSRAALEAGLTHRSAIERVLSAWFLARWHAAQGDWAQSYRAILALHREADARRVVPHPGPELLGARAAAATGDAPRAAALLARGVAAWGENADTRLTRLALCPEGADGDDRAGAALASLWPAGAFAPVTLAPGPGARFDRLTTAEGGGEDTSAPRVSVIVPAFDAAATLPAALASLSAQDWPHVEVIVVDDGSTDATGAVARAHAARDPRIRVLTLPGNAGAYAARNAGLTAARGEFVTVQDADDWAHPARLRLQAEALIARPALAASMAHWARVDDALSVQPPMRMERGWVHPNVSSLMLRRAAHDRLGWWDRVTVGADTEYLHRLRAAFGADAVAGIRPGLPLSLGRARAGSLSADRAEDGREPTGRMTQFLGARRDYIAEAERWHAKAGQGGLFLPERPARRPFPAPAAISLGDPPAAGDDLSAIRAASMFDARWYAAANPAVVRARLDPAGHYLRFGAAEGRDPSPRFSATGYAHLQGLRPEEALMHWEREGRAAGHDPLPVLPGDLAGRAGRRVLYVGHMAGPVLYGAERSLIGMLDVAVARGDVPVVVLPQCANPDYLAQVAARAERIAVLPMPWRYRHRPPHPVTLERLRALIRGTGAAALHVNTGLLDAPLLAARAEGVPSTVHVRELGGGNPTLLGAMNCTDATFRADLLAQADRFVANSRLVAEWLDVPERTIVRPVPIDDALFDLADPAFGSPLCIGMIGSNTWPKGVADAVDIARRVAARGQPVRFVLAGPSDTVDLAALMPLPANVTLPGYVAHPAAALAAMDVVLSVSRVAESYGRTVVEAMAAGRPVICYDRGMPPRLVEHGVSGLVVPAGDTDMAADAVSALSAAPGAAAALGAAARARARVLQDAALVRRDRRPGGAA